MAAATMMRSRNSPCSPGISKERLPQYPVEFGYLEFATPIIRDGLDRLRAKGVEPRLAVPGMLFAAGHAKNDIPSGPQYLCRAERHLDRLWQGTGHRSQDARAAADRIQEALDAGAVERAAHETLLVVVGRGASDPDANSNVAKVTRMLWEGFGFGWAETAYSGVTFPLVEPGAGTCRTARLPADHRIPLFSLHRHPGPAHL